MSAQNILIIYYSRTGNTKKVAKDIAEKLDGNLEEITESKSRKGFFGYMKSGFQGFREIPAEINEIKTTPSNYDLVVIGSPVWAGHISSPVHGFIKKYSNDLNKIAIFCTKGGTDTAKFFNQLRELLKKEPIASLDLERGIINSPIYMDKIDEFVEKIRTQ